MAVEKGSAFLLKVGNGAVPVVYATVAGLRTTQMSVNGEAIVVTTKDSGGWRQLVGLFWHCLRECPEGVTRERLGEAVVEAGLSAVTPVLRVLLRQILAGK